MAVDEGHHVDRRSGSERTVMRMRRLWNRHARQRELDEEIESHLRMAIQDRLERGESVCEAQESVRREFGNVGFVKEVTRDMWGWTSLETAFKDGRHALHGSYEARPLRLPPY